MKFLRFKAWPSMILLLFVAYGLSACGKTGALYLPGTTPPGTTEPPVIEAEPAEEQ